MMKLREYDLDFGFLQRYWKTDGMLDSDLTYKD